MDQKPQPILTSAQMKDVEQTYLREGHSSFDLMYRAGSTAAQAIAGAHPLKFGSILVLCGPGNNGGDGFIIGNCLKKAGYDVRLTAAKAVDEYRGDAALAARLWEEDANAILPFDPASFPSPTIIVDALFGIGLDRKLEGRTAEVVDWVNGSGAIVWAIDMPSGISADDGHVLGAAIQATHTITFEWPKPGQLLLPGRIFCGELIVAEIGLNPELLNPNHNTFRNEPAGWQNMLPKPKLLDHKYNRGHALVVGSKEMPGAGRLAAMAARRIGSGMLSVAAPAEVLPLFVVDQPGIIAEPAAHADDLKRIFLHRRISAILVGSGLAPNDATRKLVMAVLSAGLPTVIDGGALTAFEGHPNDLFALCRADVILTPHEGEFMRLFPDVGPEIGKLKRVRKASLRSNAIIVLKGADSSIAAPDGKSAINTVASPYLATAGSGDVLAGLVLGLVAQGMSAYFAACASVWFHGRAGQILGPGLIAEDIPGVISVLLKDL